MRFHPRFLLGLALISLCPLFSSCWLVPSKPLPPPTNLPSASSLGSAESERLSKAAAAIAAALHAAENLPDSPAKSAVEGALSVAQANLPKAADVDRDAALKLVNFALAGKFEEAQVGWKLDINAGAVLNARIAALEVQVQQEKVKAAADLQQQLQEARNEERQKAAADQRKMIGYIFYGGGALCLAAAAIVGFTMASVPMFGPKVALGLGVAGALLTGAGVALNELLAHPAVIWTMLGLAGALLFGVTGLTWSNHHHNISSAPAPVKPTAI